MMKLPVNLILLASSISALANYPTPNTILNGTYNLDGNGAIIDARNLPNFTGYFLSSGTLNLNNVTLQNFSTMGGTGSGGGAGLGGTIFVNQGGVLNLNNVNFYGSTITGGTGGIGDVGGVLNNILPSTSSGTNGNSGTSAGSLSAFTNGGNGTPGFPGTAGGDATNGFGGNGGKGGNGSNGLPTNKDTVLAAFQEAQAIAEQVRDTKNGSLLAGAIIGMQAAIIATQVYNANPALLGYPAAALAAFQTIAAAITILEASIVETGTILDPVAVAASTTYLIATATTAYITDGSSGQGGPGGPGNSGGNGSFGFGGGRGGDGGNGGNATPTSIAIGGSAGASGDGGDGGYGGGGGRSGIPGTSGTHGNLASGGRPLGESGVGGTGGFGAGSGSSGSVSPNGSGGGGGSGLGGAIFLREGSTLNITGPAIFCGNLALGGTSANGGLPGEAAGTDLFLSTGSTCIIDPGTGNTVSFDGTIADDSSTSLANSIHGKGAGAGLTIRSGLVIFSDHGVNTYSGPTVISGGVLQAQDGIGVNLSSNINLAGGIFEGHGVLDRFLGTRSGNLQFSGSGVSSGFSSARGDFTVTLNCGQSLVWGSTPYFLTNGANLLFGSPSAQNTVTFTNPIDLGGGTRTILATAGVDNTHQAILSSPLSNGSLTIGDSTHTGKIVLTADNTYVGPTQIKGGSLILRGSLASPLVTIDSGAILESSNSGLNNATALTVNGTFRLSANDEIATLAGNGQIHLNGGTLTLNSGTFAGGIVGNDSNSGLTKVTPGTLTLSGTNTYVGPTRLEDGTLNLTGTLSSQAISIFPGSTLNDTSGGINPTSAVIDNGILNLGANQTIGALSGNGNVSMQLASLTVGSGTFSGVIAGTNPSFGLFKNSSGTLILSGNNSYTGFTEVAAGTLSLQGTLASSNINIVTGAQFEDLNSGLVAVPNLNVNGLFTLNANDAVATLNGNGSIQLSGGILSINSGTFAGSISGTQLLSGITKVSAGTLTLSGTNPYLGPTQVNAGTFALTGTLGSQNILVSPGATFQALSGGLSNLASVSNSGFFYLASDNTILSLVNSGQIDGINTLTASTYSLQNGSIVNANLGTGVLTTTGTVNLNGTSAATLVNVSLGSAFNLNGADRLSTAANLNLNGVLNVNGATQTVHTLNGSGTLIANTFQINNGGTYFGSMNTTSLIAGGGTLNFSGANIFSNFINLNSGSILNAIANTKISNGTDITVQPSASMNINSGTQVVTGGNFVLKSQALVSLDGIGSLKANQIIAEAGSVITLPDSSKLTYQLLTGNGMINSQGNTFINLGTVGGNLTFLNNFTNQGTLSPGNSPGLTTIGGNYTEAGVLILEIENTTPVIGFDQVRVGGVATLQPSSLFDVRMNSTALVPGNFFQVIANGGGGPLAINGSLGGLTLSVNMNPANPSAILFDLGTGRILVTSIDPFTPASSTNLANLGCNSNQNQVAKNVFNAALIAPQQINSTTVAGQLAAKILQSNICQSLALFTPTFYGAMTDYAFLGERNFAYQIWNRVSTFAPLSKRCCGRFSIFGGYLQANERKVHQANLINRDLFAGVDYRTCQGFSIGAALSDPFGKIHSKQGHDDVHGVTGLGYLRADLSQAWRFYGTIVASHLNHDLHRHTLFGKVKSHAKTSSITGFLGFQYRGWTYEKFSFAPRANLVYSHAHVGRFHEKGALDALSDSGFNAAAFTTEIGFSALYSTKIAGRPFGLEAIGGLEIPIAAYKHKMKMDVVASPTIDFSLSLPDSTKTRVRGGLNAGYTIWKNTTLNAGYQLTSGGDWDHLWTAGIRICL